MFLDFLGQVFPALAQLLSSKIDINAPNRKIWDVLKIGV